MFRTVKQLEKTSKTNQVSKRHMATKIDIHHAPLKNQTLRIYSALNTPLEYSALDSMHKMLKHKNIPCTYSKTGGIEIYDPQDVTGRLDEIVHVQQLAEKTTTKTETWLDCTGDTRVSVTAINAAPLYQVNDKLEAEKITSMLMFNTDSNPRLLTASHNSTIVGKVADILKEHEQELLQSNNVRPK